MILLYSFPTEPEHYNVVSGKMNFRQTIFFLTNGIYLHESVIIPRVQPEKIGRLDSTLSENRRNLNYIKYIQKKKNHSLLKMLNNMNIQII